ncbi:MAG: Slowmo [Marteilia pararefringens]
MRIWSSNYIYDFPWSTVVEAQIKKYPNPVNNNIISVHLVQRELKMKEDEAQEAKVNKHFVLHSKQLISRSLIISPWIKDLFGINQQHFSCIEESILDPKEKSFILQSKNINFDHAIEVKENLVLTPSNNNCNQTNVEQEISIDIFQGKIPGIVEDMILTGYKASQSEGKKAINWVINNLNKQVSVVDNVH